MVKKNQRDRYIQYLEKKLNHVYSPLLRLMEKIKKERNPIGGITNKGFVVSVSYDKLKEIDEIFKNYRYLMGAVNFSVATPPAMLK